MDESLRRLLEELEAIGQNHEELFDSEVRKRMGAAVFDGFVKPMPGFSLPDSFGMYSEEADRLVKQALREYIESANRRAEELGLTAFSSRLNAFQNGDVSTDKEKNYHDDFFGWWSPEHFDADGNPLS
jgi:hypothetical protein